jgi:hypothetical protein
MTLSVSASGPVVQVPQDHHDYYLESGLQIMTRNVQLVLERFRAWFCRRVKREIPASFPTLGWRHALIRTPNGEKR